MTLTERLNDNFNEADYIVKLIVLGNKKQRASRRLHKAALKVING